MYTNKIYTTEELKKMNSQRLNTIHEQIFGFGVFNPFNIESEERYELFIAINKWMGEQVANMIEALTGVAENVFAELAKVLHGFIGALANQMATFKMEMKRVVSDNIVDTVKLLLNQGFTCAAIGNMGLGVSAKQASRIKRGRRYSDVSGIEEVKPVARKNREVDQIFA